MTKSNLSAVRIFCSDLARSLDFYHKVLDWPVLAQDSDYALLDTGQVPTVLEQEDPNGPDGDLIGRFTALSYETRDIYSMYEKLKSHDISCEGPPEQQEWGGSLVHLRDPDDNILTLVQPPQAE